MTTKLKYAAYYLVVGAAGVLLALGVWMMFNRAAAGLFGPRYEQETADWCMTPVLAYAFTAALVRLTRNAVARWGIYPEV